jgi:adenosylcobyric acid synthase
VDALAAEPGVAVTVTADPDVVAAAHLVVLPGSRATVADLEWLRHRGMAQALADRHQRGQPILGICGGYQMLSTSIVDDLESGRGRVDGLALLPTTVTFDQTKQLRTETRTWRDHPVDSYQIHHGRVSLDPHDHRSGQTEDFLDGVQLAATWGTTSHGLFENDGFRRSWLTEVGAQAGIHWQPVDGAPSFASLRMAMLDRLADAIGEHLDTERLLELIEGGCPPGLPFIPPGVP